MTTQMAKLSRLANWDDLSRSEGEVGIAKEFGVQHERAAEMFHQEPIPCLRRSSSEP